MKKQSWLIFTAALFIVSYILEALVKPLNLNLDSPYTFIQQNYFTHYPFTTLLVALRSAGLFLTPICILSFLPKRHFFKSLLLLIVAAISQLYAIQAVSSGRDMLTLEWSLAISLASVALLIPVIYYFVLGLFFSAHKKLTKKEDPSLTSPKL